MIQSPLNPGFPEQSSRVHWRQLYGSSSMLALCNYVMSHKQLVTVVLPDQTTLQRLSRELHFFCKNTAIKIFHFPDWETLPYDHFSPHEDLISERLLTLFKLPSLSQTIVLTTAATMMHRLVPRTYLEANTFVLALNDHVDPMKLRERLAHAGYRAVGQTMEHGEYALRGAILDIFPMGSVHPFRIELLDDRVESMRTFDPETQRSLEKITEIRLLPAREYPVTEEATAHFRQAWRAKFPGNPLDSPLYKSITSGEMASGAEYYLPLFFEHTQTFFDYLPKQTLLVLYEDLLSSAQRFWNEIKERYEQLQYDLLRPILPPTELFLTQDLLFSSMNQFQQIIIEPATSSGAGIVFNTHPSLQLLIDHRASQPLATLQEFISTYPGRILFTAESSGRKEILQDLLKSTDIKPHFYEDWQAFIAHHERLGLTVAALDQGLMLEDPPLTIITESQLFGEQVTQRRLRKKAKLDPESMVRNLTELSIGAPVVHLEHGVGRYLGLQTIKTGDIEGEYITLEYADQDKIYVPVASLHLISRYSGSDAEHAPVHKLGGKQWERIKDHAAKRIRDVAAELLDIYSRRQAAPGFAFPKPGADFLRFRAEFPFEETPDQTRAIDEVINDMIIPRAMDRLVCGDVGFGKTEVAMQAAFIAAHSGKQVAVLVPTTLLANQHLQSFRDRFANWPIRIDMISRLRSKSEQDKVLQEVAAGKIDIIIGTHKLIHGQIQFKDLGLLIVDEEHRFGVTHKEKIKAFRAHVDILTLTATPIPRTLNMSLSGIRDLSIIATPPARRVSIRTFVHEFENSLLREAILREILRGGQVYYLHNEVATIAAELERLKEIVPEARMAIAHGQMREHEMERVMFDFYHQKFNLLLCTTIVESGIDIPTANTIVIHHADRFGLAQLHQLRGRVGRSHHQAYAYLLIDKGKKLARDAQKRLEAIATLQELGAGFYLATHDLEIRGAGELLGDEQSGHIQEIGFSLYTELLDLAVKALKAGHEPDFDKPLHEGIEIDLHLTALLPENYVPDVHTRLTLYKRLASAKTVDELSDFKAELIDRFGLLPDAAKNLFQIAEFKLLAQKIGIKKIDVSAEFGYLHFIQKPNLDPAVLIKLIQLQPKKYQLQGPDRLRFVMDSKEVTQRIESLNEVLKKLRA